MKLIVLHFALMLIFCSARGDEIKPIKSVKVFSMPYKSGKADSAKAWLSSSKSFDRKENIVSVNEWNESGARLRSETMTYNDKGLLVASKNNAIEVLYFYDANGNLTERRDITLVGNKQQIDRKTWSFDKNGKTLEEKFFSSNGAIIWWVVCDYSDGRLIRRRGLHQDMSTYWTEEFSYDSKERKIRIDYLDNNGLMFRQEAWVYDKNGDTVLFEEYDREGAITGRTARKYYSKGKIESVENLDIAGNPFSLKRYDVNGNLSAEIIYDSDGSVMEEKRSEYKINGMKSREIRAFRGEVIVEHIFRYEYYDDEEK